MFPFQIRSGPQFRDFSSKMLPFQIRYGPLEKATRTILKPAFWHFRVTFPTRFEGGRVGSVGSLLFRTHSQQRARASRGQKTYTAQEKSAIFYATFSLSVCFLFLHSSYFSLTSSVYRSNYVFFLHPCSLVFL